MKTTLESKTSKAAIKFVASIIPRRSSLPFLQVVKCYANGRFEMTATDLDIFARAICPAVSTQEGTQLIPARALKDACAGKGEFEIESGESNRVTFRAGGNVRTVESFSADEFPPAPKIPDTARRITFAAQTFIDALRSVACAMSTDERREVINSVCIDRAADGLRLVATDGRRLHVAALGQMPLDAETLAAIHAAEAAGLESSCALGRAQLALAEAEKNTPPVYKLATDLPRQYGDRELYERCDAPEVIAAKTAARESQKLADKADESIRAAKSFAQIVLPSKAVHTILAMPLPADYLPLVVSSWENSANITAGDYSITTKLIEGNYPNYMQCVPLDMLRTVQVPVAEFSAAVKQAATVCTAKCDSVKLTLTKNNLAVFCYSEIGEASAAVAVNYSEPDFCAAFNPDYMLDVCRASALPEMRLEFIDAGSPAKITNDAGFMAVVMPLSMS